MFDETHFVVGILPSEVAYGYANAGKGKQEIYPPLPAKPSRLARGDLAELIELGGQKETGLVAELFVRHPYAEK
jgi:hypothetical protein